MSVNHLANQIMDQVKAAHTDIVKARARHHETLEALEDVRAHIEHEHRSVMNSLWFTYAIVCDQGKELDKAQKRINGLMAELARLGLK